VSVAYRYSRDNKESAISILIIYFLKTWIAGGDLTLVRTPDLSGRNYSRASYLEIVDLFDHPPSSA
jgi:hypothetical protein